MYSAFRMSKLYYITNANQACVRIIMMEHKLIYIISQQTYTYYLWYSCKIHLKYNCDYLWATKGNQ